MSTVLLSAPKIEPSTGRTIRSLKEGFADRTDIIEVADAPRRVRKRNKPTGVTSWRAESLRRQIRYLQTLPRELATLFPPVLAAWERQTPAGLDFGYEMPFYPHHFDAGELALTEAMDQAEIDQFQQELAAAVLQLLHEPAKAEAPFSEHLVAAVRSGYDELCGTADFAALINATNIVVNDQPLPGPRAAFEKLVGETQRLGDLDKLPIVRVHGELFLGNILWRPSALRGAEPQLILIDPVSAAGVSCAPALFDLVKYEMHATGEQLALRSDFFEVSGFGSAEHAYRYEVRWSDVSLQPFQIADWHRKFRQAFETRHGSVDAKLHELLGGYFNVLAARRCAGAQRVACLLKAAKHFTAAA